VYGFHVKNPVLNQQQWTTLFGVVTRPCMMHMNVTSTNLVCSVAATIGITQSLTMRRLLYTCNNYNLRP
jgi:hypothetical protein